jgi:hypothetical protein
MFYPKPKHAQKSYQQLQPKLFWNCLSTTELSSRTLGFTIVLTFAAFLLLLTLPYYVIGKEQYIPKSNPIFGYVFPNSQEAWLLFILSWILFALSMIVLAFFIGRKQDEGSRWVTPSHW